MKDNSRARSGGEKVEEWLRKILTCLLVLRVNKSVISYWIMICVESGKGILLVSMEEC